MAPWIVVDDLDTSITYLGSWNSQLRDSQMLGGTYATPDTAVQPGAPYTTKPSLSFSTDGKCLLPTTYTVYVRTTMQLHIVGPLSVLTSASRS